MTIDNVTIIIPEHNRPERLQRLLDYYHGSGARIIVADSSDSVFTGSYDPTTTRYLHRPGMHFVLKVREIMPLIDTPYVLYVADDDFAVPSGIATVVSFLEQNPDYVVAQGHYLTFVPHPDGQVQFEPRYIRYFDSRVVGDTPSDRLTERTGQYASMLYGVTRTEVFRQIYDYCFDSRGELRFRNLFLAEEFFCNAMRIYGKYATLPCFYSARERIPGSATDTTVSKAVIMTAPQYRDEYDGYIGALTDMLVDRQPELTCEQAEAIVRSIDVAPIDTPSVELKRRIMSLCGHYRLLRPLNRLFAYRYRQKGLRAVRGMASYPCNTPTPEIQAIVAAVKNTHG